MISLNKNQNDWENVQSKELPEENHVKTLGRAVGPGPYVTTTSFN